MRHTGTVPPSSCWPPSSAPSRWARAVGEPHRPLMGTAGPSLPCTLMAADRGLPRIPRSAQSRVAACLPAAAALSHSEPANRMCGGPARRVALRVQWRRRAGWVAGGLGVHPTALLRCAAAATASPPACATRSSGARPSYRRAGVPVPHCLVRSRWRRQRSPLRAVCQWRDPAPRLSTSALHRATMAGTLAAPGMGASPPLTHCQSPKGHCPLSRGCVWAGAAGAGPQSASCSRSAHPALVSWRATSRGQLHPAPRHGTSMRLSCSPLPTAAGSSRRAAVQCHPGMASPQRVIPVPSSPLSPSVGTLAASPWTSPTAPRHPAAPALPARMASAVGSSLRATSRWGGQGSWSTCEVSPTPMAFPCALSPAATAGGTCAPHRCPAAMPATATPSPGHATLTAAAQPLALGGRRTTLGPLGELSPR